MLNLKILLLSATLLLAFGIVAAQEEEIRAADLGVSEPTLLPDSPFYFFKNWGREIQSVFTFDPVKKAELRERFANEKLIELKKLAEKTQNSRLLEKAIQNYQNEIENVKNMVDRIKEKAEESERVGKFLDKFIQQQTLHQGILENLETKVSTSTMAKIREAREEHLKRFEEVMTKLEEKNEEKIQERLEKNLEKLSTSTQETTIRVRDRIMEKIQQRITVGTPIEACITLWDPVCGKDGKTYSNECFAKLAGVEEAYEGECKECQTDADCPQPRCIQARAINVRCLGFQSSCIQGKCQIIYSAEAQPDKGR